MVGLSGAEIAAVCHKAALQAVRRAVHKELPLLIEVDDLLFAFNEVQGLKK
jgi:SpoVK/Ycf46/Vps4 family AAA+-type ATPase